MWLVDDALTEIEKSYFLAVAKALALCQKFENNLKTLAFEAVLINEQKNKNVALSFDEIVEIAKKNSKVFTMIKNFEKAYSDKIIVDLFDKAREARNLIVHCSLEGCYSGSYGLVIPMKQADIRKTVVDQTFSKLYTRDYITNKISDSKTELQIQVYDLSIGDFYAGIIEWNINMEHGCYPFNAEGYAKKMIKWVFSDSD